MNTAGIIKGEINASSSNEAATILMKNGQLPSLIIKKRKTIFSGSLSESFNQLEKVTLEELALLTTQMSTLLRAGITLVEVLDTLTEQAENKRLEKVLKEIKQSVEGGTSLSESIRLYPDIFPEVYSSMVIAGELSGRLDETMDNAAELLEKEIATKNRIREVTRYPKIVTAAIVSAVVLLMTFVVPRFVKVFGKAGLSLPMPTKILMFLNSAFHDYWWLLLSAFAITATVVLKQLKTKKGRLTWHYRMLRLPLLGSLVTKIKLAQFCAVFAGLIKSGIPIIESISVAGHSTGNDYLKKVFATISEQVKEGKGIAESMKESSIIPPITVKMAAAGEKSGMLDEMLLKVSAHLNESADREIKRLSSFMEPALILILGGIVLFLALAILMPMWDLTRMAS